MTTSRGRPKGLPKSGGRKPGTKNKNIEAKEAAIAASGLTPLEYMLEILRDEGNDKKTRMDAATSAAPYCHAKLVSTTATIKGTLTFEELLKAAIEREQH